MGCTCMPHVCVAVSGRQEEFACLSGQACGAPHIVIRIACTVHSRTNCTGSCSHPARHCAALLPLAGPGRLVGVRHQPSGQCRVSCRIVVVICSLGARPTVHVWRQGVSNVFAWHARQALLVVPLHARQHASHELRSMLHVAGGWQPFHPRKRALLSVCCVCRPTWAQWQPVRWRLCAAAGSCPKACCQHSLQPKVQLAAVLCVRKLMATPLHLCFWHLWICTTCDTYIWVAHSAVTHMLVYCDCCLTEAFQALQAVLKMTHLVTAC
jgi:hypothetical protein